jgi:hypothetical protein
MTPEKAPQNGFEMALFGFEWLCFLASKKSYLANP